MQTMKRNARTLTAILALVTGAATLTRAAPADDRNWATRVKCELQTAGGESLQTLTWQQGTTPRLSLDQYRSGKELIVTNAADTNVVAIVRFGPSSTGAYFVSVTNYATVANAYLVNMPTVGTNTTGIAAGWWYTVLLERGGSRFWTGNGRLDIVATTSTGDGLVWQTITSGASMADLTAEAALRASGDRDGTNYTGAVALTKVSTNDPAYLAAGTGSVYYAGLTTYVSNRVVWIGTNAFTGGTAQTNVSHNSLLGIEGAGTLHVTATETNRIKTAWQNPASATNWTWTSDGTQITLTWYSGPADVVVPDTLDNLPVTGFGTIFAGMAITSISGGANIANIIDGAFPSCASLTGFNLYSITSIGEGAFQDCAALASINLPLVTSIGVGAFIDCYSLVSVVFGQNAPVELANIYRKIPNLLLDVTNYVSSSTATGWTNTWCGRPVVRLPVYSDLFTGSGAGLTNIPIAGVTGLQSALDGKVATNDLRVVNALTNFNDTIHGARGGLNLHTLADASGAGFYSADHYKAVTSMKGRTNVWDSAVPSTPAGIAAAGGIVTNTAINLGTNHMTVTTIKPVSDATTAVRITKADGVTSVLNVDTANKRIGFNTASPMYLVDCHTASSATDTLLQLRNEGTSANSGTALQFYNLNTTTALARIYAYPGGGYVNNIFAVDVQGNRRITILGASGNTGFGTATPAATLHVNGSAIIETNLTVGGSLTVGGLQVATVEQVVTGAVRTVTSGNRYFFTTATNVTLSASLTGGQVVNYAALRNTATNSITAVCESAGWKFTGGSLTNTLPANTMMTFGWSCNPFTGATNFYATAASSN